MSAEAKVNILVVDDRPERVLTLTAALEPLGENVVGAHSGREALRHLLRAEFAVILLDINMPGMDGFETAALIRQRPATRDVPIIFVTAYQDEVQVLHGYAMRAVDTIQVPVVPEVLRTKVGVFVDLYRKTDQVRRQADWLRERAAQLHKLTSASLAINSAASLETLLDVATATALDLLDVRMASATATLPGSAPRCAAAAAGENLPQVDATMEAQTGGIREVLRNANRPMRLTQLELDEHPGWTLADRHCRGVPLRGWLAVPLTGRGGQNLGWIEVTDKVRGDFSGDDEAILVQLAQMTSVAIENVLFAEEREVNRLKDEFLWTLSHELRTPLNAILGWTQLLAMEGISGQMARGMEVIERNARAQAKLVDDMLDLSRIIMGKLRLNQRPLDLRGVVEAAVESVRPLATAKDLVLECRICADPAPVLGDPDRLQQVVGNLLSNALKFTPKGGRVSVALVCAEGRAHIHVTDTGQGIKPSFLPHVFERFRQADSSTARAQTGLGIGLTIVRHIVELHGGSVRAESAGEGCGATFTVDIGLTAVPIQAPAAAQPDGAPAPQPDSLQGVHVLLVDDEPDAQQAIGDLLRHYGAEIELAASAEEALALMTRRLPDVLVSDIGMPQQDGYALIRTVRALPAERGGELPAIALTAYAREQDCQRALASGFDRHLAKPIDPAQLVQSIMNCRSERSANPAPDNQPAAIVRDIPQTAEVAH